MSIGYLSIIFLTSVLHVQASPSREDHPGSCEVWGQIVAPDYSVEDFANIELAGKLAPTQRARVVNRNFDFRAVPPGPYVFRGFDHFGGLLFESTRFLTGTHERLALVAPIKGPGAGISQNSVSLRELRNPTPRRAQQAFETATKAMTAGETEKAI